MNNEALYHAVKTELAKAVNAIHKVSASLSDIASDIKRLSLNAAHVPGHEQEKTEKGDCHSDSSAKEPERQTKTDPEAVPAVSSTDKSSKKHKHLWDRMRDWEVRAFLMRWKIVMEFAGALFLLIYTVVTYYTLQTIKEGNRLTMESLQLSQRAYVTLGRKDGTVADFVIPKEPSQNAEIVIYFQNSGHLPAKFAWGTMAGFLAAGSNKQATGIIYTHPYKGLPNRTRDKKTGAVGEGGAADAIIAGDSVFVSTLGTISQKNLADLSPNNMGALIMGMFEYCDELGNHSIRSFGLTYRSNAPSTNLSFGLATDNPFPILPLPESTATTEYLFPCETSAERKRNQGKSR
jgi:hypothetical protein